MLRLAFDNFSISAGKLPTLIGDEYTFTFENMNIQRGLLWNQEPAISDGVQANYSDGPLSLAISVNDGFYSQSLNWISGLASYGFNGGADTVAFVAGGNLGHNPVTLPFATPVINNGSIFNLIYTHTSGSWTISPYLQYISAPGRSDPWRPEGRRLLRWRGARQLCVRRRLETCRARRICRLDRQRSRWGRPIC